MTYEQAARRTGLSVRTIKKYVYEGLLPSELVPSKLKGTLRRDIKEGDLPLIERISFHKMERLHQNAPSLWAERKLVQDRNKGLVE